MNQVQGNRQQNDEHNTYRSEYAPANVFAHRLPVGVILHHYSHSHEQVNNHENEQANQNYFNNHSVSLNNGQPHHHRFTATRWIAIVVTLLAIGLMFRLGLWQLDRMHQKEARLASIAQKQTNGPISLFDLPATLSESRDLPVTFNGKRIGNTTFYIDNQIVEGRVGYHVLAPVSTESGNVLLNFGWVPAGAYRDILPQVQLPVDQATFKGTVSVPGHNPVVRETASAFSGREVLLQKIDIGMLNANTDLHLKPYIIQLESPVDEQFVRNWQPVVMPPKKHLAYAVQWFGLALAASTIALIVFFPRGNRNDENQSF